MCNCEKKVSENKLDELGKFSDDKVETLGILKTPIQNYNRKVMKTWFFVLTDGLALVNENDLISNLEFPIKKPYKKI